MSCHAMSWRRLVGHADSGVFGFQNLRQIPMQNPHCGITNLSVVTRPDGSYLFVYHCYAKTRNLSYLMILKLSDT